MTSINRSSASRSTPLQPNRLPLGDLLPSIDKARPDVYASLRGTCRWWGQVVESKVSSTVGGLATPQVSFLLTGGKPVHHIGPMLEAARRNDELRSRLEQEESDWKKPTSKKFSPDKHLFLGDGHLVESAQNFWGSEHTHMLHVDAHGHEQRVYVADEGFLDCKFTEDLSYFIGEARDRSAREGILIRPQLWKRRGSEHHAFGFLQGRYELLGYLPRSLGVTLPIAIHRLKDGTLRFIAQADNDLVIADESLNVTTVQLPTRACYQHRQIIYSPSSDSAFFIDGNRLARCRVDRSNQGWTRQYLGRGQLRDWLFAKNADRLVTVTRKKSSRIVTAWDIRDDEARSLFSHKTTAQVQLKAIDHSGRNLVFAAAPRDIRLPRSLVHVNVNTDTMSASPVQGRVAHVVFAPLQPALYAAVIEEHAHRGTSGLWLYKPSRHREVAPAASRLPGDIHIASHILGFDGLVRHLYVIAADQVLTYNLNASSREPPRRRAWQWGVDRLSIALGMRDGI